MSEQRWGECVNVHEWVKQFGPDDMITVYGDTQHAVIAQLKERIRVLEALVVQLRGDKRRARKKASGCDAA